MQQEYKIGHKEYAGYNHTDNIQAVIEYRKGNQVTLHIKINKKPKPGRQGQPGKAKSLPDHFFQRIKKYTINNCNDSQTENKDSQQKIHCF